MTRRPLRLHGARRLEKHEQDGTVKLLTMLGADVYVLGTRRPRGRPCPKCGSFVAEHAGTCQTPGISDLVVFLPGRVPRRVCFVEQKREGGRLSPEQETFRALVGSSTASYVAGTLDDVIAWLTQQGYLGERRDRRLGARDRTERRASYGRG
jgi:hypothetical protein